MNTKVLLALLLLFFPHFSGNVGAASPSNSISAYVLADLTNCLPFTPVHLLIELRNTATQETEVVISEPIIVEYRSDSDKEWEPYSPFGAVQPMPTPPRPRWLKPGEALQWFIVVDVDARGSQGVKESHVLADPNSRVDFRAHVDRRATAPISITVTQPTGEEDKAYEELRTNVQLAACFSENVLLDGRNVERSIEECRSFAERYSHTTYGAYARLGWALVGLKKSESNARDQALSALIELGERGPLFLRARALWYASRATFATAEQRRDLLARSRQTAADPYFRSLINRPGW